MMIIMEKLKRERWENNKMSKKHSKLMAFCGEQ